MTIKFISENVFNTINQLSNEGNLKAIEKWLSDCNKEIIRREQQKENIFPLQYEKKYLESLCMGIEYKNNKSNEMRLSV